MNKENASGDVSSRFGAQRKSGNMLLIFRPRFEDWPLTQSLSHCSWLREQSCWNSANAPEGSSSISTVIDSGVWMSSSISVSEDAEDVRVIDCGEVDAEGVYSNGKMVRISEVGILAFGKSDAMKRRSPMGVKVQTSRKRSRFVCERTARAGKSQPGLTETKVELATLTFDDDDLAVDDGNCE